MVYNDPNGHCPACVFVAVFAAFYAGFRGSYEISTIYVPGADQIRRDQIGGALVTEVGEVITSESTTRGVDPILTSAILRHESAAFERRLLTAWPSMGPGLIANSAEFIQSELQGDTASIGPGQMQLRRARELESLGYVREHKSDFERRLALLGQESSVEYVVGMVQYLSDNLNQMSGFHDLSREEQQRLVLIGYNWGWELLEQQIKLRGFQWVIEHSNYDEQTLNEYLRWSGAQ